mmetsp:Transcript_14927/g.26975  ORF Transcript_14927/g.26975 Transcript_14927/m.26975 type:complete len:250 (+) Transcript_14927:653-1402(+)
MFHNTIKQHVCFCIHDFSFRHSRNTSIIHFPPFLLGETLYIGNIMSRMTIGTGMHNNGKESTKHSLVMFLERLGEEWHEIKELFKLDVTFNLGRTGLSRFRGGNISRKQLRNFATTSCRTFFGRGRSIAKPLEMKGENWRNGRQTCLFGSLARLAALFALVPFQHFLRLEFGKGRTDIGQCTTATLVRRHIESNVFNGINRGATRMARLALDLGFDGSTKELKGIFVILTLKRRSCMNTTLLHGINQET